MSSPYPPQPPPRKLERSRSNRVLGGVCAGVATYLNMDVNLVRVLTVVVSLFTGFPVVLYIVALFLVPEEQPAPYQGPEATYVPNSATGPATGPGSGTGSGTGPSDPVWGSSGAPWDQTSSPAGTSAPPPAQPSPEPGPSPAPDAGSSPESPATAAPEGSGVVDPEPIPETSTPKPTAEETSSWESAPADPEHDSPESGGQTPPSTPGSGPKADNQT